MSKRIELVICLGSSCFARGNKKIVTMIKEYIEENNLSEYVYFHGNHCFGYCERGPIIKINDRIHEEVSEGSIRNILDNVFKGLNRTR